MIKPLEGKAQRTVIEANARTNILDGSVRSGKTIASLLRWLRFVREGVPGNLLMVGRTERTLKRNVIDLLIEMLGPKRCRLVQGSGELWLLGRRVYLVGANDLRSTAKIQGVTLAGAYVDEASTIPEDFWAMLLSRLSLDDAKLFATTNPDSPMHWLKKKYLDRAEELGIYHQHFTLDDNPHLSPAYVEAIKREYTGLWYKRYILGLWAIAEGSIYDMLDEERHFVDRLPVLIRHWIGMDFGFANPTVAVPLSLGEDGYFYVHHEFRWDSKVKVQKTGSQQAKLFQEHMRNPCKDYGCNCRVGPLRPERIFVDPSALGFRVDLHYIDISTAPADNAVRDGIVSTGSLLSSGLLKFHRPTVQRGWEEMVSYAWDPKAQQAGDDAPLKQNDHFPDAFRYVVRGTEREWRRQLARFPHLQSVA